MNTAFRTRRVRYDLSLGAGADVDVVRRIAADVLTHGNIEGVERDPVADVLLLTIGAPTTLRLLWWSRSQHGDYLVVQDRVLTALRKEFAANGIALA